ncbi:MAG: efflux RND transporter periplasmic adaptor subunit [Gammaproteobacteria bacterium]|nr:efflux RND transporter periplasmic adaptor subunit [Gammaproteobacteria bacterium]
MRATYITALAIAALIIVWFVSGQVGKEEVTGHPTLAERNAQARAQQQDQSPTRVRAQVINASPQMQHVVLRGKTESKRTVQVRAETSGRIVKRPVERGTAVDEGDLLCQISMEDRYVGLLEAREALNQARIEYKGSLSLKEKGFQSDTAIAKTKARLAAAEAQLKRRELDIERTFVRAPFAGVVEDVHQEIGDFVASGAECVTVVDLDPMLLIGRVAEKDVHLLELKQPVTGVLNDGREVTGPVTFIGQQSDPATRTYAVEVQVPNDTYSLRSGVTTEIRIPVAEIMSQKISPALFALDDAGNIGVRTTNEDNRVEFHMVQIVREDLDGVWVSGLPEMATLITVGQELVVPGETVEIDFEPSAEMPAAAPNSEPPPSAGQANHKGTDTTAMRTGAPDPNVNAS